MNGRLVLVAVLVATMCGYAAPRASAGESGALCPGAADSSRQPAVNNFGDRIDYCFDGERLHIANRSNAVVELQFDGAFSDFKRDQGGGSVSASAIGGSTAGSTILPPSYAISAAVNPNGGQVTRYLNFDLSYQFLKNEFFVAAVGFIPGAGDGVQLGDAIIKFINEIEEVGANYLDCLERNGFWGKLGCQAIVTRDLAFALARAVVNGVPVVNDLSKLKTVIFGLRSADLAFDVTSSINDQVLLIGPGTLVVPAGATGPTSSIELPDQLPGGAAPAMRLTQGAQYGGAYWYSVELAGFAPNSSVTVVCHDSVDASFYSDVIVVDEYGEAVDSKFCFSNDGPEHWVTAQGYESNRVVWGAASTPVATTVPAPNTTAPVPVTNGSVAAVGRTGPCEFGSACLIASFTISGFSPHPGRYTCVFSDGFRAVFTFSGNSVNTACYTAVPGETIFIEVNGVRSNVVAAAPPPNTTAAPAATVAEIVGVVTNTWTNYNNAGGAAGPQIPRYSTVQIACRLQGFAVANGNTWWYRIASPPWNGQYYASADAFYNTPGMTSGSLKGTPWVDERVPLC